MKRLPGVLSFLVAACITGYAGEWEMFRGNPQRTGYSSESVGLPLGKHKWKLSLGCNMVSSPSVSSGLLFVGGRDSCLYAVNANTGEVFWKRKTRGWIDSSPLIFKNLVAVGSRDGRYHLFEKQTGASVATVPAGLALSSPLMLDGNILLGGLGPPLNGLGKYRIDLISDRQETRFAQMSYSSPAIWGDAIFIGANDGRIHAIGFQTMDTLWSRQTQGEIYLATPAVDEGIVYFAPGGYDAGVYALKTENGELLWHKNIPVTAKRKQNGPRLHPKIIQNLLRLSPEHRQQATAFLAKRGVAIPKLSLRGAARADFEPYGDLSTASVAVDNERVYVVQELSGVPKPLNCIMALDKKTGALKWIFEEMRSSPQLGYCSSPVVAGNKVFFGWGEGKVYGLNTETGAKVWEDSLDGPVVSSPAISQGKLYFATYKGALYAFDLFATADPQGFLDGTYCYPNPAKTESRIQFYLEKPGNIEVRIYDGAERLVRIFRQSGMPAGIKDRFAWDVSRAANGVYFALVTASYNDGTSQRKILKVAVLK